ncbi:RICIN domain-containing protein [Micromonospora sp. R77]|uniref:RICIN domain-containing protein n=1 Tax=Micromonospora sp. R77 TaxID=2925836 RepID=UPI001F60DF84|nr:RICIN domain-containing protein [Micromonospora sp. R77]MCI4061408.1 RICIN domain-containing protein [Micromonospora sp. R77]
MALSLTIVVCAALAFEVVPAIATGEKLKGAAVPDEDVPSVVSAALSCPSLTPPKVAAQVMAATAFGATGGSRGIADLDDGSWQKWRPWKDAQRTDRRANILALAHRTCEHVGTLRSAGVKGDLWAAAVAAGEVGVDAVKAAKGVPGSVKAYVDKVKAYANWYANQPQFSTNAERVESTGPVTAGPKVPDDLVDTINAAGKICPTMTPARIAAQLRVLSGFDANRRSSSGAAGIAQFTTELWDRYQPREDSSMWNPADAIPAMTIAMCDLTDQFTGLSGADPYTLALGAYQWGPDVIRLANGLPRTSVPQLAHEVARNAALYEKDSRLGRRATKPAGPKSPPPTPTPTSTKVPTPEPSKSSPVRSAPPSNRPEGVKFDPGAKYLLHNVWAGSILDMPGRDLVGAADNTRVTLWANLRTADMYWRIADAGGGYVTITNAFNGKKLAVENASKEDYAKLVVLEKPTVKASAEWQLIDAGEGQIYLKNRNSGKVMDLLGDDLGPPNADGTWNGYRVEQYTRQDRARDQRWMLIK